MKLNFKRHKVTNGVRKISPRKSPRSVAPPTDEKKNKHTWPAAHTESIGSITKFPPPAAYRVTSSSVAAAAGLISRGREAVAVAPRAPPFFFSLKHIRRSNAGPRGSGVVRFRLEARAALLDHLLDLQLSGRRWSGECASWTALESSTSRRLIMRRRKNSLTARILKRFTPLVVRATCEYLINRLLSN